ncbi:MAG TPA: hypothetical protein VIV12_28485 [Streptosporangiaceae bacterium]
MAGDLRQAPGPAAEPGADEIVLTAPAAGAVCDSLACRRQREPAAVVVAYGRLGGNWWDMDTLWPECWGRSYPNCAGCWDRARKVVRKRRPGLVVRDRRPAAAGRGGV